MSAENENKINEEENVSFLRRDSTMNEAKNLVLMKKGDYTVHILIEEVKSLPQLSENHLPYPIIKLTVFNQSKRTEKTKVPCDSYTYDEHFYFDKADLTVEQLDSSKILIEVRFSHLKKTASSIFCNVLGIDIDCKFVHSKNVHCSNTTTPSGMVIEDIFLQPLNAPFSIIFTELGILIEDKFSQLQKAFFSILLIPSWSVIVEMV